MKLSPEERMTFVEKYLRNEVSMAQAADAAGVPGTVPAHKPRSGRWRIGGQGACPGLSGDDGV